MKTLLSLLVLVFAAAHASASERRIVVLDLQDTIQPASLRYLERGLREAADEDAALIIVELDTPGGLLDSTRAMTSAILASRVPVVIYVTPAGARAASAGFFLLLAGDVAAMAPGTNTGAAHPVTLGGRGGDKETDEEPSADPAMEKAAKDAAALARSLAERRSRSVLAAEQAIFESASFSAKEARTKGLVDLVAPQREQLIEMLDGRKITRFDGSTQTLELRGAKTAPIDRTFAERLLTVIAAPQVAYLLMMLGAFALLAELMSPGLIVPGVAGALSMLLGLYGLSVLPVNVVGALLVAAGFALLVAEVFVTSYGLLAIAGLAGFVTGSLILVEGPVPELRIGPEVVVPLAVVLAAVTAFLSLRAVRSRHHRPHSGTEAMIGEHGNVIMPIEPDHDGKVFVHGEYWVATSAQTIPAGSTVRVDAVEGLRLRVTEEPRTALQGGLS